MQIIRSNGKAASPADRSREQVLDMSARAYRVDDLALIGGIADMSQWKDRV
jgi:hypothetical protein